MQPITLRFRVRVIDQSIELPNGKKCEQTVILQEYINNIVQHTFKYGYVDREELYKRIDAGDHIDLDYCYVNGFSLNEYRESRNLEEQSMVRLERFSAVKACFDSEQTTDFSFAQFEGKACSFAECIFANGNTSFLRAQFSKGNVDFSKILFGTGNVEFQYAMFNTGNVSFQKSHFEGKVVSFVNANFDEGNANFKDVEFGNATVKFQYAKFGDGIKSFDKAEFGGKLINFRRVEFGSGRVDFKRAIFGNGEINFEEAEFTGTKFSFRSAAFGSGLNSFAAMNFGPGEVAFDQATFGRGQLSFRGAVFGTLSFKGAYFDGSVDLRVKEGDRVDLSGSLVRDIIDLKPEDEPVKLRVFNITGMRNLGKIYLDWNANQAKALIRRQKHTTDRQKANQFILLKEGFHDLGEYNAEDHAYVEFRRKEMSAWIQETKKREKWKLIYVYPSAALQWLLFDVMGLYATSPIRVFASMMAVYVMFSLIFMAVIAYGGGDIVSSVGDPDQLSVFDKSFYHSAITFLTIGYGDFYPSGHIRWLSSAEGWMGLFLMSYFTVAFVRKILR